MTARFARFHGVDFSGARNAGTAIWIAEGTPVDCGLRIEHLRRARDLPDGGTDRTAALSALRAHLAVQDSALIGLDFPFSLPGDLVDAPDWTAFARRFARRYPDPEAFRDDCRQRAGGRELKRRTDRRTATPFCAYNLRLYRQTYWGIAEVLAPLAEESRVAILPVLERPGAVSALAETCPASTLKRLGCYRPYKGREDSLKWAREAIFDRLEREGLGCPGGLRRMAVADTGGDAIDAIIAAMTMWRVSGAPSADFGPRDRIDALEARVFAWPTGSDGGTATD